MMATSHERLAAWVAAVQHTAASVAAKHRNAHISGFLRVQFEFPWCFLWTVQYTPTRQTRSPGLFRRSRSIVSSRTITGPAARRAEDRFGSATAGEFSESLAFPGKLTTRETTRTDNALLAKN